MITAILVMLWLVSCAGCMAAGFFFGYRYKHPRPTALQEPNKEEQKRLDKETREMENFFSYDGSEQEDTVNTR